MRNIDDNLLAKLEGQEIKPFYLLDMKLPNGNEYVHYRVTDRDVPITNVGKTLTEDRRFECHFISTLVITDAHWSMVEDPNDDTKILDRSTNEYSLTINGDVRIKEGIFKDGNDSIYLFNGTKDYLSMPISGSELGGNYDTITFSFWIKPDLNIFTRNADHAAEIINKYNTYIIYLRTDRTIRLGLYTDSGGRVYDDLTSTDKINLNEWNFVSCRYTASTATMSIKINDGDWISGSHSYGGNIFNTTSGSFYIGKNYYCGYVADVRIYHYYLGDALVELIKGNPESNWARDNAGIKRCPFLLVPDGDDAGWTIGAGSVYNDDDLTFDFDGTEETVETYYDGLFVTAGYYNVNYTITGIGGDSDSYIQIYSDDGTSGAIREEDGEYSDVIVITSVPDKLGIRAGNYCEGSIGKIKIQPCVKKVTGAAGNVIQRGRITKDGLYRIKWKISNMTGGSANISFGGHCVTTDKIEDGEYEDYLYCYGISQGREYSDITIAMSTTFDGTIDWIDVNPVLWITRDIDDTELLEDWNFAEGDESLTPWEWGDGWSSPVGKYQADFSASEGGSLHQDSVLDINTWYRIEINIEDLDSGSGFYVGVGDGSSNMMYSPLIAETGTQIYYLKNLVASGGVYIYALDGSAGTVKRISCTEIGISDIVEVYESEGFEFKDIQASMGQIVDKINLSILDLNDVYKAIFVEEENVQGSEVLLSFVALDDNNRPLGDSFEYYRLILFDGTLDSWDIEEDELHFAVTNELYNWNKVTMRKYAPSCTWRVFGENECPYQAVTGNDPSLTTCDRSYNTCVMKGMREYFGGFRFIPGLVDKNIWWGQKQGKNYS